MADLTSGSLTNYNGSIQYLGGSSGLDVNALIDVQLQVERMKIDPLYTTQEYYQTEKQVWQEFKSLMDGVLAKSNELKNLTSLNQAATTSKDGIVSVTANGEAVGGTYNLSVEQLATSHKIMSDNVGSLTEPLGYQGQLKIGETVVDIAAAMSLKDIAKAINKTDAGVDATVVGGHLFMTSQKTGQSSLIDIQSVGDGSRITSSNNEAVGLSVTGDVSGLNSTYSLTVDALAKQHKVESNVVFGSSALNYGGTFTLNGEEFVIAKTDTITDIVRKINANENVGVTASVSGNKLVIQSKEVGANGAIQFTDSTTSDDQAVGLFQHIGLTDGTSFTNETQAATDAVYSIDGVSYTSSTNKIDAINGLTLTLKQETTSPVSIDVTNGGVNIAESLGLVTASGTVKNEVQKGQNAMYTVEGISGESETNTIRDAVADMSFELLKESSETVQIGVSQNDQAITDKMKEFVSAYNSAMNFINRSSQEEAILQGDSLIKNAKNALRSIVYETSGNGMMMFEVGLQGNGTAKDGTIVLDEAKFKEALENDYDKVMGFLTGSDGVATKFYNRVNEFTRASGMIDMRTESLDASINRFADMIDRKETSYERFTEQLVEKYSALESMMSSMNSTLSYLTAMFSSKDDK